MTTVGSVIGDQTVHSVGPESTVSDAAIFMAEKNIGAVAVIDGTRLVGIFSERDVITRVLAKRLDPAHVLVGQVMTREIVVADVDETEESCLRKMKSAGCRHLPIISGEKLVGIISLRDLLQVELTERDEKLEFLNDYLFHLPPDMKQRTRS